MDAAGSEMKLVHVTHRSLHTYHHCKCCTEFGEQAALQTSTQVFLHTEDTSTPSADGLVTVQRLLQSPHPADYKPRPSNKTVMRTVPQISHCCSSVYQILRMCTRLES